MPGIYDRFWTLVDKNGPTPSHRPELGPCWQWKGPGRGKYGYGGVLNGEALYAHRRSWEMHYGPIPPDLHCLHKCDNTKCVRPDHLFIGTHSDNMKDCHKKGRRVHPKTIHPECMATGDKNGMRTHPESRSPGDRNGSRIHPERIARGENHIWRRRPDLIRRGSAKGAGAKLDESKVSEIRRLRAQGLRGVDLSKQFSVSQATISLIVNRKKWTHVP